MVFVVLPLAFGPGAVWFALAGAAGDSEAAKSAAVLLVAGPFFVLPIGLMLLYPVYKAIAWRWWVGGVRFRDLRFESNLRAGALTGPYWAVLGWAIVIILLEMIVLALAMAAIALTQGTWEFEAILQVVDPDSYVVLAVYIANYVVLALALGAAIRFYLFRGVWERVANSVTVFGLEAANDVRARGDAVSALGEGFADSLDIGGI
jgi:hypothetical protein